MNKPVFKTAGIMTAAAILTIVIFAQTKPPVPRSRTAGMARHTKV